MRTHKFDFFFLGFCKYSCFLQNIFSQKETSTTNIIASSSHFENALIFDFSEHSFFKSPVGKQLGSESNNFDILFLAPVLLAFFWSRFQAHLFRSRSIAILKNLLKLFWKRLIMSATGVFLWVLQNFLELCCRTTVIFLTKYQECLLSRP